MIGNAILDLIRTEPLHDRTEIISLIRNEIVGLPEIKL
jgi:hypothetical protein